LDDTTPPPGTARAAATRRHVPCLPSVHLPRQGHPPRQRSCHGGCYRVRRTCHGMCYFPPYGRAHPAPVAPCLVMSNGLDTATRSATSPLRGSPDPRCRRPHAQPWSMMLTVIPRFLKTPRCHACCEKNPSSLKLRRDTRAAVNAPSGVAIATSIYCTPAAVPGGPDTDHASKAVMVCAEIPALTLAPSLRHLHRAKRWRRLVAGSAALRLPWCVEHGSTSSSLCQGIQKHCHRHAAA